MRTDRRVGALHLRMSNLIFTTLIATVVMWTVVLRWLGAASGIVNLGGFTPR